MAHTRDDLIRPNGTLGDEGVPDGPIPTNQDPAGPGGRGSAVALWGWSFVFLLIVVAFFYALGGC